jgi:vesicle-fusing ATPase
MISCNVSKDASKTIKIISNEVKQIFKENISFHSLGIGGLDTQFAEIFRRAFNSRRYP